MTGAAPHRQPRKAPAALERPEPARLVPLGHFVAQLGLLEACQRVPFPMQTIDQRPSENLGAWVAHLQSGGRHGPALATSAHPLSDDQAVAAAWGPEPCAAASGVNALLRAATPERVAAWPRGQWPCAW